MVRTHRSVGVVLAVTSAASFGIMPVWTKVAYDSGANFAGVLSVRFSVAAVVLLAIAVARREPFPRGRQAIGVALLGGVGYVVESLCYFAALDRVSAGLTALLLYVYPALVVLLAAVAFREPPSRVAVSCVVVATVGTALTIGPVGGGRTTGVLLGLGAAAAYAVYIVVSSRVTAGLGPFVTAAVVMGSCGLVYDVLARPLGASLPHGTKAWAALLGVAFVGTVVAVTCFFGALSRLGPGDTAVISTVEPVVSVAAAFVVLGETLDALQLVGGALVLVAVAVLARHGRRNAITPV